MSQIKSVGVIGSGQMGAGIAHVAALAGYEVWLHDVASERFPDGVLYAVHDDQGVVALDWRGIAEALELPACPKS